MKKDITYCGYIGIVGRTNVGKSSILNQLIGRKISITSHKSGTTQKNIVGIHTIKQHQCIYIDTPGIEIDRKNLEKNLFQNKYCMQLIIFVINKTKWLQLEDIILQKIKKFFIPIILIINKIDHIKNKTQLLPFINLIHKKHQFLSIIPISAKTGKNINILSNTISNNLPKSKYIFLQNNITIHSKEFIICEIIREKLIRLLNQEIPYLIKVQIERYWINSCGIHCIYAIILSQNIRQKKIIIGKNGNKIKKCYLLAKHDIQKYLNKKIILTLNIKTVKA
ncbi:GTPase Era [Buchnera aphidicola (Takecallis arundicolens)]|uniref:GTPase Era n=1 Tax=Buchnera aphidicola TaxID=9 RepID=UPI0034649941